MRSKTSQYLYYIIIVFVGFYILFKFYEVFSESLFMAAPDRINMLLYGPETYYYSLDRANNRDYAIAFQPDVKVDVPGGYGTYRVGSLGKLALLDDDPELIKNTFALTTTTFVHFVFLEDTDEVYYGQKIPEITKPPLKKILFNTSNAAILDRLYLAFILFDDKADGYQPILFSEQKEEVFDDIIGLLFQETYRDEHESIQVLYPGQYATAQRISDLLEGNGIRVSDISYDISQHDACTVVYSSYPISHTARDIGSYFGCLVKPGKTDVYDILFLLGEVEEKWKVN